MQRDVTKLVAIRTAIVVLTTSLAGCSYNLPSFFSSSDSPPAPAPAAASDDATCQAAGLALGTPEYQECMQNLAQQRLAAERAEIRPYYVPQR